MRTFAHFLIVFTVSPKITYLVKIELIMNKNKKSLFVLMVVLLSMKTGFSSIEKRLVVNMLSKSYQERLIDIETISHGLLTHEMFYNLPVSEEQDGPRVTILIRDSVIYALEHCRFNVWEWQDTGWVNLYKDNNKGWCIGNYYIQDGSLLGFTGNGFWSAQSGIYLFDQNSGGWEIIATKNKALPFSSFGDFRLGKDTIISFFGYMNIQGEGIYNKSNKNYGVDLKTKQWFRVKNNFDYGLLKSGHPNNVFDMENTVCSFFRDYKVMVDKSTLNIFYVKQNKYKRDFDFYYNDSKSITVIKDGDKMILGDSIPSFAIKAGSITFSDLDEGEVLPIKTNTFYWITIALVVFIIGVSIGWFISRFKKDSIEDDYIPSELIVQVMLNSGQLMGSDKMDEMLGTGDDPNPDSRRVKRSRIIQEINTEYQIIASKELITRQRDPNDKRFMLYKIEN